MAVWVQVHAWCVVWVKVVHGVLCGSRWCMVCCVGQGGAWCVVWVKVVHGVLCGSRWCMVCCGDNTRL